MSILTDVLFLFISPHCPVCGAYLLDEERTFCSSCRLTAPFTGYSANADNPMFRSFMGIVPVESATALIHFSQNGWRKAIHEFKYRGAWRIALDFGKWVGHDLLSSDLFRGVDMVVPVPLHPFKKIIRGYNQSDYIAKGVAQVLQVPVLTTNMVRRHYNRSQTRTRKSKRWSNVQDIFAVRHPEQFAGKHILLVDDVFTTGATITSCALAIIQSAPDVRISVATIATAHSI